MNTQRVLEKISEIVNASAKGNYIYRGESKCHCKVSSTLYRAYEKDIEAEYFDIQVVQEEILKEAKDYTAHKTDTEILTELQHHGGKTNLIDFTTDFLVALFFACNGKHNKPGRVILLENTQSEAYEVVPPPKTIARARDQKSIFVQPSKGVVDPYLVVWVCIPADLKESMLVYLRKHHDISTKTIYNDLPGFIKNRSSHKSEYTEFYKGLTCQDRGDSAENPTKKQEWHDKAVAHYTAAIGLNPELATAYHNRGAAYYGKGEFDKAIQDFNKTIDLDPEDAIAYYNRGNAYSDKGSDKGELDKAIQDFNKAIDLNPHYAIAYNNRGVVYGKIGEFDKAIQGFNKTIDLNPKDANAYYNRGNAYSDKGELDKAIQDFNKAIDLNPHYADAYSNRGNAYQKKNELDRAIQDYNNAIDLNPEDANAYCNRGVVYGKIGDLDAAIQDYSLAINLNPEYTGAYHNRGNAYAHKRKFDRAIQDYSTAVDLNPEFANAYYNRGIMRLYRKEWAKAKADLITAKHKGTDLVEAFHNAYESAADFEVKHDVKVPKDIAALLSS